MFLKLLIIFIEIIYIMEKSEGLDNLKHDEITEWIFNQLHTELINRTDIEHIEVEVRLGWIKQTQQDFNNGEWYNILEFI